MKVPSEHCVHSVVDRHCMQFDNGHFLHVKSVSRKYPEMHFWQTVYDEQVAQVYLH